MEWQYITAVKSFITLAPGSKLDGAYRENQDDSEESEGNDDLGHDGCSLGPPVPDPHPQCNRSYKSGR
jgi:hypothetical protein